MRAPLSVVDPNSPHQFLIFKQGSMVIETKTLLTTLAA